MSIITLTTDYGTKDYYLARVKGSILGAAADVSIVDISHEVEPFNIVEAAFVLKNAYTAFPERTIHLINVNALENESTRPIAIYHHHQYFLGLDNGTFSLVFDDFPDAIVEISALPEKSNGNGAENYSNEQRLIAAAAKLANGAELRDIGNAVSNIRQVATLQPVVQQSFLRGTVIFIDHYENVITNVTRALFDQESKGRNFALYFKRYDTLDHLSVNYFDVPVGEMLCLFNNTGHLEIAINQGKASSLLGLHIGDTVQMDFL